MLKRWNIARQVSAQEIAPPIEAPGIAARQEALRKAAAQPQHVLIPTAGLGDVEGAKLPVSDTASEALRRLAQEFDRSGAEKEEASGPAAPTATFVDQASENAKQIGRVLDLVEYDELVLVRGEVECGICQLVAVGRV